MTFSISDVMMAYIATRIFSSIIKQSAFLAIERLRTTTSTVLQR